MDCNGQAPPVEHGVQGADSIIFQDVFTLVSPTGNFDVNVIRIRRQLQVFLFAACHDAIPVEVFEGGLVAKDDDW